MSVELRFARPEQPDPDILDAARIDALERLGKSLPGTARWFVDERVDRRQSTLFHLRLHQGDELLLRAFYKVHRIDESAFASSAMTNAQTKADSIRRVLVHGRSMADKFNQSIESASISVPQVLTVDVERLVEVQVEVPGQPLRPIAIERFPPRRELARRTYRLLGEAIATIESLAPPSRLEPRLPSVAEESWTRLGLILGGSRTSQLHHRIDELQAAVTSACPHVCAHGDLNSGHVLASKSKVSLIDLLWATRWRGQDLALQAAALRAAIPESPQWSNTLIRDMLSGYGDPELYSTPQWKLIQVVRDINLAVMEPAGTRGSYRKSRAVKRLREPVS